MPVAPFCMFQLKWKMAIDSELHVQKRPRNTWSHAEIWMVAAQPRQKSKFLCLTVLPTFMSSPFQIAIFNQTQSRSVSQM